MPLTNAERDLLIGQTCTLLGMVQELLALLSVYQTESPVRVALKASLIAERVADLRDSVIAEYQD